MACGGDPKGTWLFAEFCPDTSLFPSDPSEGQCKAYTVGFDFTNTREVTIDGTNISTGAGTETMTLTANFPLSCFQADGGGAASCSDVFGEDATCTDKGGGNCECVQTDVEQKEAGTPQPYTVNGNVFTFGSGQSGEYCVSGNLLYFNAPSDGGAGLLYVLKRK